MSKSETRAINQSPFPGRLTPYCRIQNSSMEIEEELESDDNSLRNFFNELGVVIEKRIIDLCTANSDVSSFIDFNHYLPLKGRNTGKIDCKMETTLSNVCVPFNYLIAFLPIISFLSY